MNLDLDQLKQLIESGDKTAIEEYIKKDALEKSDMKSVLELNKQVKSFVDSAADTHHAKALQTWKENNLQGLIDTAVEDSKADDEKQTPDQKRIAALEQKLADAEAKALQDKLMAEYTKQAAKDGVPIELLNLVVKGSEEDTKAAYEALTNTYTESVSAAVEAQFKNGGRNPETGGAGTGGKDANNFGAQLAKNAPKLPENAEAHYFGQ